MTKADILRNAFTISDYVDIKQGFFCFELIYVYLEKGHKRAEQRRGIKFSSLERAKECKEIVRQFINDQKCVGDKITVSKEENKFWKSLSFEQACAFWDAGDIVEYTKKVVG